MVVSLKDLIKDIALAITLTIIIPLTVSQTADITLKILYGPEMQQAEVLRKEKIELNDKLFQLRKPHISSPEALELYNKQVDELTTQVRALTQEETKLTHAHDMLSFCILGIGGLIAILAGGLLYNQGLAAGMLIGGTISLVIAWTNMHENVHYMIRFIFLLLILAIIIFFGTRKNSHNKD